MRVGLAILAAAAALSAAPAGAQENCPAVAFERGEDVATIGGRVSPDDAACFRLDAEPGESFTLNVIRGDNVVFSVAGVADARERLTFTADEKSYKLVVGQPMRSAGAEEFEVAIVRSPAAAGAAPSRAAAVIPDSLPPETRQRLEAELADMLKRCRSDWQLYPSFHDCQCLGGKFVEARLRNPGEPPQIASFEIRKECVDPQGIMSYAYRHCAREVSKTNVVAKMKGASDRQWDAYCRCFAQTVAKTYSSAPDPSYSYISGLEDEAFAACPRPPG